MAIQCCGRQVVVGGDQPDLGGVARDRRQRRAQVAPRRRRADVGEAEPPPACPSRPAGRWPTARWTSRWSNRPGGRHHQQRRGRPVARRQPVPRRAQHGRLLHTGAPAAHHRRAGRVEAVRQPGAGAVDAGGRGGAALGAGLAAGDHAVAVGEAAAARRFHHRVGGDVGGNPVGGEAFRGGRAERVADRHADRAAACRRWGPARPSRRWPARRSCRPAPEVGPAHRPGRPLVDHPRGQRQHLEDHQQPRHDRQRRLHDSPPPPPASSSVAPLSRPEKWNHAASSRASTVSPSRIVVNPKCHSGNWIRPRHPEVGDVPPAVDAGERQRGDEQHRGGEDRPVASRPHAHGR